MKHKTEVPKHDPKEDRSGWYSTFDVIKIFGWRRGLIKNWIEGEYIEPKLRRKDKRGQVSYFAGFQLYTIRLFKHLLDIGIPRKSAKIWVKFIENEILMKQNLKPTFAVFDLKDGEIKNAHFIEDPKGIVIDWKEDSNDFFVLNFRRLIKEVDKIA